MQQDKTPMPDVDDFDPNVDPGANRGTGRKRDSNDDGLTDEDVPLPPDVEDRNAIEEPDPTPPAVEDPNNDPKQIVSSVL